MSFPADALILPGTNTLLRPFPFRLEFPITETREFATDVVTAEDGTEQRAAVRDPARPRQRIGAHVIAMERDELAHQKALLFGWSLKQYGVPLWIHAMQLSADATEGVTALSVDESDGRDLAERVANEEDVPLLLWRAHDDWEPFILSAVDAETLTARAGIARDWPAGTIVLPLALMLLVTDPVTLTARAGAIAETDLEFVSVNYPISPNACDDADDTTPTVRLVRGAGADRAFLATASPVDGSGTPDGVNAGALHPQVADPVHDLFGFSETIACGMTTEHGMSGSVPAPSMYPKSRGRATGMTHCTPKAPAAFHTEIHARGLGTVVGDDCALNVWGTYPAGLDPDGNPPVVSSGFSGSGYFLPPGAPGSGTVRQIVVASITLHGGLARAFAASEGSVISSYGRYDDSVPGGIQSYPLSPEGSLTPNTVVLSHGYCVRCTEIAAFVSVKLVAEAVLYDEDGHETGDFGDPVTVTHAFTSDDYTDAGNGTGAFAIVTCGEDTLFGDAHMALGSGLAEGYGDAFDLELFRLTVSLIDADDVEHLQFQDIFPTMLVQAALSV